MTFSSTLMLAAVISGQAQEPLPTIAELIQKLHAPRQAIESYELVIDQQQVEGDSEPHLWRIWRDGTHYRTDHLHSFNGAGSFARLIQCEDCERKGATFTMNYDVVPNPGATGSLKPNSSIVKPLGDLKLRIEDFGAMSEELINTMHRGINTYNDRSDWTKKRVERCIWKDKPAFRIVMERHKASSTTLFEVTFLPECGFAAVQAKSSWNEGEKRVLNVSESDLSLVAGIWLPKVCVYTKHVDGKLTERATQKVDFRKLNQPIDPKVFTLRGMDLTPGTLIQDDQDGEKTLEWEGEKLGEPAKGTIRFVSPTDDLPVTEERRSGSRRLLLYVLGGAAVLASGYFAARLIASLRSRRTALTMPLPASQGESIGGATAAPGPSP